MAENIPPPWHPTVMKASARDKGLNLHPKQIPHESVSNLHFSGSGKLQIGQLKECIILVTWSERWG